MAAMQQQPVDLFQSNDFGPMTGGGGTTATQPTNDLFGPAAQKATEAKKPEPPKKEEKPKKSELMSMADGLVDLNDLAESKTKFASFDPNSKRGISIFSFFFHFKANCLIIIS